MLNRRKFLQGTAACAAVAGAALAGFPQRDNKIRYWRDLKGEPVSCGVQDYGNGWYRCWMSHKDYTLSSFARASSPAEVSFYSGCKIARFDVRCGEVLGVETSSHDYGPPFVAWPAEGVNLYYTTLEQTGWTQELRML